MSNEKQQTQWNIRNVPIELDKEVKIYLATNDIKLYEFVLSAVEEQMKNIKSGNKNDK